MNCLFATVTWEGEGSPNSPCNLVHGMNNSDSSVWSYSGLPSNLDSVSKYNLPKTSIYMSLFTFVLWQTVSIGSPVVFVSEQTVLTFESYILFLNTVTGMSKLSTIKPGVRVRNPRPVCVQLWHTQVHDFQKLHRLIYRNNAVYD